MKWLSLLLLATSAMAGERALGTTSATDGGSANNRLTAVTFSIENGTLLSVECDTPSRIGVGVGTCTAATCPLLAAEANRLYPTSCTYPLATPYSGYSKCLVANMAADGGVSNCNWFQRYGNEGATRARSTGSTTVSSSGGSSAPSGQAYGTTLTSAATLYVNSTTGADTNDCTSSGSGACASVNGAWAKVGLDVAADLTVSVAVADAGLRGFYIPPFRCQLKADGGFPVITIQGEALVDASGLTSPVTGTVSSAVTDSTVQRRVLTTGGGLTAGELRGWLFDATGAPGSGCQSVIEDNTTTTITLGSVGFSGCSSVGSGTAFRIRDSINVTSPFGSAGIMAAGTYGLCAVNLVGIGSVVTSGPAVRISGNQVSTGPLNSSSGTIFSLARLKTTAASQAVLMGAGGSLSLRRSSVQGGTTEVIGSSFQGLMARLFLLGAVILSPAEVAGSAVRLPGAVGVATSNGSVRLAANTSGVCGFDLTGWHESSLSNPTVYGGGSNTAAYCSQPNGTSGSTDEGAPGGPTIAHPYFDNVGVGVKIAGPGFIRMGGANHYGSGVATVFDISHGGRVMRQGVNETTGYTTYLVLDGVTYANGTDVDASHSGDIMSPYLGSVFDSFP